MVKAQISITIDRGVLKKVDAFQEKEHPGGSRSYAIEILVREGLKTLFPISEVSIAH